MPTASATKTVRLSSRRLAEASKVFDRIGVDPRSALEMFLAQVALKRAIPFPVDDAESDDGYLPHQPNAETLAALADPPVLSFASAKAAMAHLRSEH